MNNSKTDAILIRCAVALVHWREYVAANLKASRKIEKDMNGLKHCKGE